MDIGGGIGIISSEIPESNFIVNTDISLTDLINAKKFRTFENLCSTMKNLPFTDSSFDYVICSHLIEIAKQMDLEENNNNFPIIKKILNKINRVLKNEGILILTTPNNEFYKSKKLNYYELKEVLENQFSEINLKFFNIYPKLSSKYRKMNLANVIPKILSKFVQKEKILNHLIKPDKGENISSVSFYIEATKHE